MGATQEAPIHSTVESPRNAATMVNNLRVFPEVALKIRELVNDPGADIGDVVGVLQTDPVLVIRVMKMASAAGRAAGRPVADLDEAVRRLGFRAVREIAMAMCFGSVATRTPAGAAQWQHSIEVAAACRVVAESTDARTREAMFLAGLLHDLGRILMLEIDPEWCAEHAHLPDDSTRCEAEKQKFGWDYGLLGGRCIRAFGISGNVADMVHAHHTNRRLMQSNQQRSSPTASGAALGCGHPARQQLATGGDHSLRCLPEDGR